MAWVSGYIRFNLPAENERLFKGDLVLKKNDDLVMHGIVIEAATKTPLPGVLVKAFARSARGHEWPLNHTYSGSDGHYMLSIDKQKIPAGTAEIFIRAAVNHDHVD